MKSDKQMIFYGTVISSGFSWLGLLLCPAVNMAMQQPLKICNNNAIFSLQFPAQLQLLVPTDAGCSHF
jgi:hypothetical protein